MAEYMGKTIDLKHLAEAKRTILQPGEELEGIFYCVITPNTHAAMVLAGTEISPGFSDYLIVTNKHVIAWDRDSIARIENYEYRKIAFLKSKRELSEGEVEFTYMGDRVRFRHMARSDVPIATRMIETHLPKVEGELVHAHAGPQAK